MIPLADEEEGLLEERDTFERRSSKFEAAQLSRPKVAALVLLFAMGISALLFVVLPGVGTVLTTCENSWTSVTFVIVLKRTARALKVNGILRLP